MGRRLTAAARQKRQAEKNGCKPFGCGSVFKIAPDGSETELHAFDYQKGHDGGVPLGGLIADNKGNLFGTTAAGGIYDPGTVFELSPNGVESVLYSFKGGSDGAVPEGTPIEDNSGNLYGTTLIGGGTCGCGTVFKVAPDSTETILHTFTGTGGDGSNPLISDRAGNLYGTTSGGGNGGGECGCGTVFKLAPDGTETVLHAFAWGNDGASPQATLLADDAGDLFGTTTEGGGSGCSYESGCGTVFKLTPDGTETILYAFAGGSDGADPVGSLVADDAGNL